MGNKGDKTAYVCVHSRKENLSFPKKLPGKKKSVSVILATLNEEGNIRKLVSAIRSSLKGVSHEIIIVDDNSGDKTPEIMDRLASESVIALHRYGKKGIFSAITDGIKLSRGEFIVIMDADFSHSPECLKQFLKHKNDYDIISASRFVKGGGIKAPLSRVLAPYLFSMVAKVIMGIKVKDLTNGYHMIRKSCFDRIKFRHKSVWGEFDLEIFYRSAKMGFRILEIPYTYIYRTHGASKSQSLLKYGFIYFRRALQLRLGL